MSDTQGTSPAGDGTTPHDAAVPAVPATDAVNAAAPVPPTPAAPAAAAVPPVPAAPQGAGGWQPPRPPYTGAPAYHPGQTAAYPQHPGVAPTAVYGAAFGAASTPSRDAANQTQPTVPFTGTVTTERPAGEKKKSGGAGKVVGLLVAAALVGGAAGLGTAYAGSQMFSTPTSSVATGGGVITVNNPDSVTATTAIAAKVLPSVVTISVSDGNGGGGTGSGAILTDDGYVVTNTHVVTLDGASADGDIQVTTSDGRIFSATIVGLDPVYDLAVIKLDDASGLTPIEFADSSELNVGDQTVAVGAPLGLANTVTTGIVSALNRSIEIASSAVPDSGDAGDDSDEGDGGRGDSGQGGSPFQFDIPGQEQQQQSASESIKISVIQTDAAINPGNSGGALVDSDGKLIGINVAIATSGGSSSGQSGNIGVGFSIPSNIVERVTDELIADGEATHGLLGATVSAASAVENATIAGAYIAEVSDGGAAAAAGLKKGDIVTAFNGVPISDSIDLTAQVRAAAGGSDATVTYVRDGKTETTDVTLGQLP